MSLRVGHSDEPHQSPTLTLAIDEARPGSRWQIELQEYSGDSGSVGMGSVRVDDKGEWQERSWTSGGRVHLIFEPTSRAGQHCEVSWDGAFELL